MIKIAFILSMPNVGSWNGKWTGEKDVHAVVKNFTDKYWEKIKGNVLNGGYYNFGDGWGASIDVKMVTALESKNLKKRSVGFCGYDWMIDSLIDFGEILNTNERRERRMVKEKK